MEGYDGGVISTIVLLENRSTWHIWTTFVGDLSHHMNASSKK